MTTSVTRSTDLQDQDRFLVSNWSYPETDGLRLHHWYPQQTEEHTNAQAVVTITIRPRLDGRSNERRTSTRLFVEGRSDVTR